MQQFLVLAHPQAHTETPSIANVPILGGVPLGQLRKEFFIWFMSRNRFVKLGWILSLSVSGRPPLCPSLLSRRGPSLPCEQALQCMPAKDSAGRQGWGAFSSEFITVQSLCKGSHLTLVFVFPSMKIVRTMTNPIHCQCSSWNISNKATVNQLLGGRKRGRYWDSGTTKVGFNTAIFNLSHLLAHIN